MADDASANATAAKPDKDYTGTIVSVDPKEHTLQVKSFPFSNKKFNLGDDCAVVINGKPKGKLTDLRPGESLIFSYYNINGVNVVDRIAPAKGSGSAVASK